ncbi:hypothetical protein Pla52o_10980 [Novipirellula galeiformis]|uniref:Uncharacterized protein n=1 Tax=Novipirellula galeiformis TaxID=2528004 RepID=A0A5C6CQP7_9BACT|nr:hypothetical protein Pla52o_10980 [Novipirellula galeiformis]
MITDLPFWVKAVRSTFQDFHELDRQMIVNRTRDSTKEACFTGRNAFAFVSKKFGENFGFMVLICLDIATFGLRARFWRWF